MGGREGNEKDDMTPLVNFHGVWSYRKNNLDQRLPSSCSCVVNYLPVRQGGNKGELERARGMEGYRE